MNRHVLMKDVVVADREERLGARKREILRLAPEHDPWMYDVPSTERGRAADDDMGHETRPHADPHRPLDHDVGPDRDARIDLCRWIDDGGRMNHAAPLSSVSSSLIASGSRVAPGMRYCSVTHPPRSAS